MIFSDFFISRITEILIESNFWLEVYAPLNNLVKFTGYLFSAFLFKVTQTEWRGLKNLEEKTEYLHRLFFSTTNKKITTEDPPPLILHDKLQSIIM